MNSGETNNLVTMLVAIVTPMLVRWGMTPAEASSFLGGLAAAAPAVVAGIWAVYSHWNMKKVPETAVVTKP